MNALVIYESMYGNTRAIAEAIVDGLRDAGDMRLVPVTAAEDAMTEPRDLLVVGGPTHVHGMSRPSTRQAAIADGTKNDNLSVEPHADGPGIRDFLASAHGLHGRAAAFDTRVKAPAWLTGRAAKGIARGLKRRGFSLVADPESFLVTKDNRLVDGEADRARLWGASLGRAVIADAAGDDRRPVRDLASR
jgi:hypothetical protein